MAEYPRRVRVRVLVYQAGKETQYSLHSMYRKAAKVPFVQRVESAHTSPWSMKWNETVLPDCTQCKATIPKQPQDGGSTCNDSVRVSSC